MKFKQKVVKGLIWSATEKWGMQFISFLSFVLLSRLLKPESFGLVALATVFTSFIQIFLDRGFSDAIVQREEVDKGHLDTAFWIGMLLSGCMTLLGFLASELIANLFREPNLAPIIRWLSFIFLINGFSNVQKAILRRELAFKSLAIRSMFATIAGGSVGVIMALLGFGVWSLVVQDFAFGIMGAVVLWKVSDWRPGFTISKEYFNDLFGFSLNVIGSKILEFFNRRTDDFLIGYFLGATALGYYTVAYRILLVLIKLLTGISTAVAFPAFSKLQSDQKRIKKALYNATQYTSIIAFPVFLGILTIAPDLIIFVFGAQWEPSIPVMQVLSLAGILQSILLFNNSVIRAVGKSSWELGILLINTILYVIGFVIVVNRGILAVAIVFVIVGYLLSPISVIAVHRLIGIEMKTYLKQFVPSLVGSIGMVFVILFFQSVLPSEMRTFFRLGILVIAGGISYAGLIFLTARDVSTQIIELAVLALPNYKKFDWLRKRTLKVK